MEEQSAENEAIRGQIQDWCNTLEAKIQVVGRDLKEENLKAESNLKGLEADLRKWNLTQLAENYKDFDQLL